MVASRSVVVLVGAALALTAPLGAQSTTRVTTVPIGIQLGMASEAPVMTADGRYFAFASQFANLVAGDTNGRADIFVLDAQSGLITLESLDSSGGQANNHCRIATISNDGRYVAFESAANNLVSGDTNGAFGYDIFVRDRLSGTTRRASVDSSGAQADFASYAPALSADGRFVAFQSSASNLVVGDTDLVDDVFVHDLQSGATTRVSVSSNGDEGDDLSGSPVISCDGRFVAFQSFATTLVTGDTNSKADIFVHDRQSATTTRVSVASNGAQGNGVCPYRCALSPDGRFVAFESRSTNLVAGDTNALSDVFVHDRQSALTLRANVSSSGAQANAQALWPAISGDGRYVAFVSAATNLVNGDANGKDDVFVRDLLAGTTELASVDSNGAQANDGSGNPIVSGDGRYVVFASLASNLVIGDTNAALDLFVRDRGSVCSMASYCTAGTTTNGCVPSIAGIGTPSSTASTGFDVVVSALEGGKVGLIFYGLCPAAVPWALNSPSYRCVSYPVQRTGATNSGGTPGQCDGELRVDFNAWLQAHPTALGSPFFAGEVLYAQGWFRDSGAPKGTNLSDGLRFALCN